MTSINRVTVSGNLTRDPELKALPTGTSVLSFGIAVNDSVRNSQTGEWEDRPNFFSCVVFGPRAEGLSRFLTKGMKVALAGKLRYDSWETEGGQRRSKVEIVAEELDVMAARKEQSPSSLVVPNSIPASF